MIYIRLKKKRRNTGRMEKHINGMQYKNYKKGKGGEHLRMIRIKKRNRERYDLRTSATTELPGPRHFGVSRFDVPELA